MDAQSISAVAMLDDPVRASLYRMVCEATDAVTREQAAKAVGISRKLAAFHLDKLVAANLLVAGTDPGTRRVGRAPKSYRRSEQEVSVSLPPRTPQVLTDILIRAVTDERPGERATGAALRVARERGTATGAEEYDRVRPGRLGAERAASLAESVLRRHGFQPERDRTTVRLRNCPLYVAGAAQQAVVCDLNREYLAGMVQGMHADGVLEAAPVPPGPRCCCVEMRAR